MPDEYICSDEVGTTVLYGKTDTGDLVALQVDVDGKVVISQ